jgi:hypothetical protein
VSAILFACLGYWYGSTNPGGFSTMTVENLGIDSLLKGGLPRDHPGAIATDKATLDQTYQNSRIALAFTTPAGYLIKDFWPGDITDLMITASSFEHLSIINTEQKLPDQQMEISYVETLDQLNSWAYVNVVSLDDYLTKLSADTPDTNGQTIKAVIKTPEKVQIGNLSGYKAQVSGNYADKDAEMYFVENNGKYFTFNFRNSKGTSELKDKVLASVKFN